MLKTFLLLLATRNSHHRIKEKLSILKIKDFKDVETEELRYTS